MIVQTFMFYIFSIIIVLSALMVIVSRNPVHSVLFLILAFFNSAAIFLLQGAEFLAMIMVVVYVGAVAVLFLFVVMMLDIDASELRKGFVRYLPLGLIVAFILGIELVVSILGWRVIESSDISLSSSTYGVASNTELIGNLLYTHYFYIFQGSGLILLVAMLGAITLTLRIREGVKRQKISLQNLRSAVDDVELVEVASGVGLGGIDSGDLGSSDVGGSKSGKGVKGVKGSKAGKGVKGKGKIRGED